MAKKTVASPKKTKTGEQVYGPFFTSSGVPPLAKWTAALEDRGIDPGADGADGEHSCVCPAHDDRSPSLTWRETAMGEILFNCHAGCEGADIVAALDLKWWHLKHVGYEFDYFDPEGQYKFTVKRSQKANGAKQFSQYRKGTAIDHMGNVEEDQKGNGLVVGEGYFWLEPALQEWAEDLRSRGETGTLVLCEGEKDTVSVWNANGLGAREGEFCTTTPGGSEGWNLGHTERIERLIARGVLSAVTVVCDPDPAGAKRGAALRETLQSLQGGEDLAVRVCTVDEGVDLALMIEKFGRRWEEKLREIDEAENRSMMEEGTAACGWMLRFPLGLGAQVGRVGLALAPQGEDPKLVIAADIWPTQQFEDRSGWIVQVQPPRGEARSLLLKRTNLSSKGAFDRWMIEEARVSLAPRSGVGAGEVAASLAAWLDWLCEVRGVGVCVVTEATDWVDPVTGQPVRKLAYDGTEPVWVDGSDDDTRYYTSDSPWPAREAPEGLSGATEAPVGLRYVGTPRSAPWGRDLSERECAQAWAQALLFGDRESVAGIAGWAASMMLMPWLGRWAETKPGLAVIANSGSGKTSGAGRLILGLCGAQTNATMTPAALRRSLSQGGVSSIYWLDDSSHVNDDSVKEILRVATSQGDHVLGNADAGAGATSVTSLRGCLVVSAEGVSWLGETAMNDRFCFVHPQNPQGRIALWGAEARSGDLQWSHVQDWMRVFDNGNRVAGWTVQGLWAQRDQIEGWIEEIGKPKGRSQVPEWLVSIGIRALVSWLRSVRDEAGSKWLKKGAGRVEGGPKSFLRLGPDGVNPLQEWDWLIEVADARLEQVRSKGKPMNTVVTEVLSRVFADSNRQIYVKGQKGPRGGLVLAVPALQDDSREWTHDTARAQVSSSLVNKFDVEAEMPLALVDGDNRVWACSALLARWVETDGRIGKGQGDIRTTSKEALRRQIEELADVPEWAHTTVTRSGGRTTRRTGLILRRGNSAYSYVRLNEQASLYLLADDE